jgi:hypothetical protein
MKPDYYTFQEYTLTFAARMAKVRLHRIPGTCR